MSRPGLPCWGFGEGLTISCKVSHLKALRKAAEREEEQWTDQAGEVMFRRHRPDIGLLHHRRM